jgi:predicted PhzF superfamily epimerase YddE/YHI9
MIVPWLVDTFAAEGNTGNPAGVALVEKFPPNVVMQAVARVLSLPATAFLEFKEERCYGIRWFTPITELDICGHGTIASACYLYATGRAGDKEDLRFEGRVSCIIGRSVGGNQFSVAIPRQNPWPCDPLVAAHALPGVRIRECWRTAEDLLIEVANERAVRDVQPLFEELAKLDFQGHIITARGDSGGVDFVSRTFLPALGINEDQVCVSSHSVLGSYWARKLNCTHLTALQVSPKGGRLAIEVGQEVRVTGPATLRHAIPVRLTDETGYSLVL